MMRYRLSFYDLKTGQLQPIFVTEKLIEAPNWHPDGTLIVNGDGTLFRIDPKHPSLTPIPIEGLKDLNNDHGITPDGKADHKQFPGAHGFLHLHRSAGRGHANPVTRTSPSWWHGISPDGATIVYTARRNGVFDIFRCPIEGGEEQRGLRF